LTDSQRIFFEDIKKFVKGPRGEGFCEFNWSATSEPDRIFILELVDKLGLSKDIRVEDDEGITVFEILWNEEDDESDEESEIARLRILKKYEDRTQEDDPKLDITVKDNFTDGYTSWKMDYYKEKLDINRNYDSSVQTIVFKYVEGLQWVLKYYYHGVPSWEWYYPYHYAPKITGNLYLNADIANIKDLKFEFELGIPFRPFDQLLAVLPPSSKKLVPSCLQELMISPNSPIIDFYPERFELDLVAKKALWEAIVKIPFIDEKRLLQGINSRLHMLTKEEKMINKIAQNREYYYDSNGGSIFHSAIESFPSFNCYCGSKTYVHPSIPKNFQTNKLFKNARVGPNYLPGYPSMHCIPHSVTVGHHNVTVFHAGSTKESFILSLNDRFSSQIPETIAHDIIGKTCYIGYPFLIESRILSLSDELFVYKKVGSNRQVSKTPHNDRTMRRFSASVNYFDNHYSKRFGVMIGDVEMTAEVEVIDCLELKIDGSLQKKFVSSFDDCLLPIQLLVFGKYEDPRLKVSFLY
jgi:5'-3' exoribonuclease 1